MTDQTTHYVNDGCQPPHVWRPDDDDPRLVWNGPPVKMGNPTAIVAGPGGREHLIETELEGLAAIASALFAIAESIDELAGKEPR